MLFEWENSIEHVTESGKLVWEWVEQVDFEMNTRCEILGHSTLCVNHCTWHLNLSSSISWMFYLGCTIHLRGRIIIQLHHARWVRYVFHSHNSFCEETDENATCHMSIQKLMSLPLILECSTLAWVLSMSTHYVSYNVLSYTFSGEVTWRWWSISSRNRDVLLDALIMWGVLCSIMLVCKYYIIVFMQCIHTSLSMVSLYQGWGWG